MYCAHANVTLKINTNTELYTGIKSTMLIPFSFSDNAAVTKNQFV